MILTNRKLGMLAIVAACMLVLTVVVHLVSGHAPDVYGGKGTLLIQGLDVGKVAKISVQKGSDTVTLTRSADGGFTVAECSGYPASIKKINELLIKCLEVRVADVVTESKDNHAELGVAEDGEDTSTVKLFDEADKLLVGVVAAASMNRTGGAYVRLVGEDKVLAAEGSFYIRAGPTEYVDTTLVDVKADDVRDVTVKLGKEVYVISRDKEGKIALANPPKGKRGKETEVSSAFGALGNLSFDKVDRPDKQPLDVTGTFICKLKKHITYTVRLSKKDDKYFVRLSAAGPSRELIDKSRLIAEDETKSELEKKDAVLTAVQKSTEFNERHSAWVYEISSWQAEKMLKPLAELLEDIPATNEPEEIAASHILIGYKGADRSEATRSKEEARKRAAKVLEKAKADGADFAALAKEFSDGPSKTKGGDLGTFKKGMMHKNFEAAAWKLQVGGLSDVVETPFGFHIIERTK